MLFSFGHTLHWLMVHALRVPCNKLGIFHNYSTAVRRVSQTSTLIHYYTML